MENFNQIVSSEPVFSEKSVSERYFLISPTASLCSCFDLKGGSATILSEFGQVTARRIEPSKPHYVVHWFKGGVVLLYYWSLGRLPRGG